MVSTAIPAGKAKGKRSQRDTMGGFGIHATHERHEGGGNGGCHGALLPRKVARGKALGIGVAATAPAISAFILQKAILVSCS
jgi:hypothetical protein